MTTHNTLGGITARNRGYLRALHRHAPAVFTVSDAASAMVLDNKRTHRMLAYLTNRGWLARVNRGVYVTVPLDTDDLSHCALDPWQIAAKVYGPEYYVGGCAACEYWGLTDQFFHVTDVLTTRPFHNAEVEMHGFRFLVGTVRDTVSGIREVQRDGSVARISDPSRTVVDILARPSLGGGIRHVGDVVAEYLEYDHRDDDRFIEYAERLGNRTVFKRMGFLAESMGVGDTALLDSCRTRISSGMGLLDPDLPNRGRYLRRWNLRVNSHITPERTC